jgi:membrane-associated protease RseP (regulator of RpoE activity)
MRASTKVPLQSEAGRARPRPPWWMFLLAASFLGYFVLLVYCDIWRPESPGFVKDSTSDAMIVRRVAPLSPGDRAGLQPGDRIVSWDGRPTRDLEWMFIDANLEIGRPLPLVIERGTQRIVAPLTLRRAPWNHWLSQEGWLLLCVRTVQLVSLILGFVIALKRPFDPMARLGVWLLATVGVFCVVLPSRIAVVWRDLPVLPGALLWLPYLSALAFAALLATFVAMSSMPA